MCVQHPSGISRTQVALTGSALARRRTQQAAAVPKAIRAAGLSLARAYPAPPLASNHICPLRCQQAISTCPLCREGKKGPSMAGRPRLGGIRHGYHSAASVRKAVCAFQQGQRGAAGSFRQQRLGRSAIRAQQANGLYMQAAPRATARMMSALPWPRYSQATRGVPRGGDASAAPPALPAMGLMGLLLTPPPWYCVTWQHTTWLCCGWRWPRSSAAIAERTYDVEPAGDAAAQTLSRRARPPGWCCWCWCCSVAASCACCR